MTLAVPLSPEVEAKLRARAAARGEEPTAYASKLLEQAVSRVSVDEILLPLRQQFRASGVSDDELVQQITDARSAYRNEQ
jgi:hypothetical protein